jgi:hypothetical protein
MVASPSGRAARYETISQAVQEYQPMSGLYGCIIESAPAESQIEGQCQFRLQRLDNGDLRISMSVHKDRLNDGVSQALAQDGFSPGGGYERIIPSGDMSPTSIAELLDRLMTVVMGADDDYQVRSTIYDNTE